MKAGHKEVFNEINITPLTDIFLVLLIIMMVVAPLLEYRQLDIAVLPPGEADESTLPEDQAKSIHVSIDATGRITIGDIEVAPQALADELRKQKIEKPDGLVIETHPDAPFTAMAQTMDAAQQAQIADVLTAELNTAAPEPATAPATPPPPKPAKGKKK